MRTTTTRFSCLRGSPTDGRTLVLAAVAAIGLLPPAPAGAQATGDAARGAQLFDDHCSDCHNATRGTASRKGPNLFGVVGRMSGTVPDFTYSDANRAARVRWDAPILLDYLKGPKAFMPGTAMKFKGLPDARDRTDVIAFLATLR